MFTAATLNRLGQSKLPAAVRKQVPLLVPAVSSTDMSFHHLSSLLVKFSMKSGGMCGKLTMEWMSSGEQADDMA